MRAHHVIPHLCTTTRQFPEQALKFEPSHNIAPNKRAHSLYTHDTLQKLPFQRRRCGGDLAVGSQQLHSPFKGVFRSSEIDLFALGGVRQVSSSVELLEQNRPDELGWLR